MSLVDNDDIIEAFAAYRADQAFRARILPRRARSDQHFIDAHVLDALLEGVAVEARAITNQKPRHCIIGKRLDDLPGIQAAVGRAVTLKWATCQRL